PDFAKAGAAIISFHAEATETGDRTIRLIPDSGLNGRLLLNPATPPGWLDPVLHKLDLVLLMSVNPGFAGPMAIPRALPNMALARQRIDAVMQRTGRPIMLEVDGGVKVDNIAAIAEAGADTFVSGSAIFGSADYGVTIAKMREELRKGASTLSFREALPE